MITHPLPKLEPEDRHPVSLIMIENINEMKTNYKKLDDITIEVRNYEIEHLLKFDGNGKYEYLKCETCDGPILGHQESGCRSLNGIWYDGGIIKSFENWLDRIPLLQHAVTDR